VIVGVDVAVGVGVGMNVGVGVCVGVGVGVRVSSQVISLSNVLLKKKKTAIQLTFENFW